uniref:Protein kinase domain-containing protein n=1 Tax=Rhizophagus irregularis (strain DAOM 181602 / DAOM 197198 / MUCL 43194) TaxID=747089 RepID=U9UKT1_RHIID
METLKPDKIIEWISYDRFQNIKYLTKGGCSKIYTADWIDGYYVEWNSKEKQLKRFGTHKVILKKLENIESANKSWFDEGKSHLTISNKYGEIVQCFGLTQDPSNGNYMLVMNKMDIDLRKYLQQNHDKLTWKERIQIADDIIYALSRIHKELAVHRDIHSGNILFSQFDQKFYIGDLGFCGPADKPLDSTYGNLPYIAPEVISGKETTFASDIYSIGILMWEISSGRSPFVDLDHDWDLAVKIINGERPKIIPGTPLEYKELIKQCWDADPTKRPKISDLKNKIKEIKNEFNNNSNINMILTEIDKKTSIATNYTTSSRLFTSKVYKFENLPEPRNGIEGMFV